MPCLYGYWHQCWHLNIMRKLWNNLFLEERPSIALSFFRIFVAITVGTHVIPSFFHLDDNYFATALKTLNGNFFTLQALDLVQKSPDWLVVVAVWVFCASWLFFLIGLFSQASCIVMTISCYYFYALNAFPIGTLSWDILLVTLFLMCVTPYHGDYFSVDCLRRNAVDAYKTRRPYFLQRLLQMQIACTYFYTALYKTTAEGNWITGNPIYEILNYPPGGTTKYFLLRDVFMDKPHACYVLGLVIVAVEFAMPVLLWWRRTRISAIWLGVLFHITLILTLDVPAIFFFLFPPQLLLFIHPDNVVRWIEGKRFVNARAPRARLVFDGHCGFCQDSVSKIKVMDLFGTLEFVDYQTQENLSALHPDLNRDVAASQLHLIEPDGKIYGGFDVFRRLCFTLPMLYPTIPIVYCPGSGIAGPCVYRFIAKNRYLFHTNKACRDNACFRQGRRDPF